MNSIRQADIFRWAQNTFGEVAATPRERALRFVEEALELAQACDLEEIDVKLITDRVFGRDAGDHFKEMGQAALTLEALAECHKVDLNTAANVEFARIIQIPKEEFAKRHAAKVAVGIAS